MIGILNSLYGCDRSLEADLAGVVVSVRKYENHLSFVRGFLFCKPVRRRDHGVVHACSLAATALQLGGNLLGVG